MRRAMKLWITAAREGEMEMPMLLALAFAYSTAPVIGFFWLVSNFKRKR